LVRTVFDYLFSFTMILQTCKARNFTDLHNYSKEVILSRLTVIKTNKNKLSGRHLGIYGVGQNWSISSFHNLIFMKLFYISKNVTLDKSKIVCRFKFFQIVQNNYLFIYVL